MQFIYMYQLSSEQVALQLWELSPLKLSSGSPGSVTHAEQITRLCGRTVENNTL